MGKRKPQNNFVKSTPKATADDESSEGEENLHRDLQQGRLGAAFIHPQRKIWAPETPVQQNPTVSTSAEANVVVAESFDETETEAIAESFDADDEQEKDTPQPSTSNAVRIFAGTIPIPTYHNAYGCYTNRYQEGKNPPYSIYRTWPEADDERDVRLIDSDNYPESSPEFMRVGPGYPEEDFRPSYNRCETGRHLRFHGFLGDTPDYIRSGNYYRDHPDPDLGPNAVTCIHTCEHDCALANPEVRQAEYERLIDQRDNTPAMLRDEPPSFMQMTFRSLDEQDEQAEESVIELNEALNCEAPIDAPLSESQILEQTTQDLDINYDSRENLNYTESGETFEEFEAQLVHLLECMKYLSTVNSIFREFFMNDDIDENWPRSLSPTEKIKQYEQCFSKIVEMDIWENWDFPDPNHFQRMIYRGPDVPRVFRSDKRIRRALSVRPGSPIPGPSRNPELFSEPEPESLEISGENENNVSENNEERAYNEEQVYPRLDFSEIIDEERSLLIRFAYRAEILSAQLNNVLGRPNFMPPLIYEGDTNTHRGLHTRYDFLSRIMQEREGEIPALNQNPNASLDHTSLINQRFLRASIQSDQNVQAEQTGQANQISDQIDLSNSQADLNSNIQITYPETSASSFSFAASTSYYTGNTSTGNGNDTTGNGNGTTEFEETTNYQEFGQNLIARQLTSTNVDSYVTYDPLSIEPIDGVSSTNEIQEVDDEKTNHDTQWLFRFKK